MTKKLKRKLMRFIEAVTIIVTLLISLKPSSWHLGGLFKRLIFFIGVVNKNRSYSGLAIVAISCLDCRMSY